MNQMNNPMMMGNQMNQMNNQMMMGNLMNQMNNQIMMGNQMNQMNNQMMMGNLMYNPMIMEQMNQMNDLMMMGNQINNQIIIDSTQNIIQQKDDKKSNLIKIIIRDNYLDKKFELTVDPNEKAKIIYKILKEKVGINYKYEHTKFYFNAKKINMNLTFFEIGIVNNSYIFLINTEHVQGGEVGSCVKSIADPTKKAPVEWPTTKDGPFYLTIKNGINIFGFCQNKGCQAYKKEVCSPFGFGTFDLIEDLNSKSKKCPKCPACECLLLEVESCGFMNCEYQYIGKKYENKKLIDVNFSKKTKGGYEAIDYIDPGKKGENKSMWVELLIKAKKLKK